MTHYDVIIIGSGAGGATMAQSLAPSGKSILILERGEALPIEDDNWNPTAVFVNKKYRTKQKWSRLYSKHQLLGRRQYKLLWRRDDAV
jgi:choline dehydrogenase-like flavoprotein